MSGDPGENFPSIGDDPANGAAGAAGAFRAILRKFLQGVDGMLPATVIAVDKTRNYVTVKPMIMVLGTDGQTYERAQIMKVPVFTAGAGNFVMSFPLAPDDLGWIIANDRDISVYLQKNAEAGPNTNRLHSFEDAVFFPDKARQWTLADEDTEKAVWQSLDGSIKVTLGSGKITIVHPTEVHVDCPLVTMTGDLTVDGTIKGKTDVLAGGDEISGKDHTHGGVTTGGGHTGAPDA